MQLYITIPLDTALSMPLHYNHIVQAALYKAVSNASDYGGYMHDMGFSGGNRKFKLFTFGRLLGEHDIRGGKITFRKQIELEVRSPDPALLRMMASGIREHGVRLINHRYSDASVTMDDITVEHDTLLIEMVAPMSVYSTDPATRFTTYYDPREEEFSVRANGNMRRKYEACYGVIPDSDVILRPWEVKDSDKIIVKYKAQNIHAWTGKYVLAGERKYLDFLYQTGIGSKNAQGLGMFDVIGVEDRNEKEEYSSSVSQ